MSLDQADQEGAADALKPIQRRSLSDEIVAQIVDLIARDVLKPGERLPAERELCKRFGVGRTSLREALRSLVVMGILEGRVGEGTYVCRNSSKYLERTLQWGLLLDTKKVQDLVETRLMLESQNAFLAAQRATDQDLRDIAATLDALAAALERPEQFLEVDLTFHLTIARATQNTILANLLSTTRGYLQAWVKESLGQSSQRAQLSLDEHRVIFAALETGRAEEARDAMSRHILSSSVDLQARTLTDNS
ncbi:MAG: FCD domain-containing protein [Candidatus Latescibacteria bacterium]|nr:FCD domain-containing protein [Candidatus Latescibacterota bacterium]